MRHRSGFLLATVAVLTLGAGAAGLMLWRTMPGGPPAELAGEPPPTAPPPVEPAGPLPPVRVEVAGGAGRVLPVAAPGERTLSDTGLEAAEAFARRTGTDALLVWHLGALQMEWYGPGVQPFDRMEGRGLQGVLLALLAGRAVQDGFFTDPDQPLRALLPEWAQDPRGGITLRQLLQGTSGLDRPQGEPEDDIEAWALSAPLAADPGSRFAPNDTEIQVLALVLERAAGEPLPDYLSRTLWRPLGARTAEMQADGTSRQVHAGCCFSATARDWLNLGLLVLENGQAAGVTLVPTPWMDLMQRPLLHSRNDGTRLRLAWPFDPAGPLDATAPFREPDTVILAGADGQRLYISRGADLVVLRLGRAPADWDESALPNIISAHLTMPAVSPRGRSAGGTGLPLPPIDRPPPIPRVEAMPLPPLPAGGTEAAPAADATDPANPDRP